MGFVSQLGTGLCAECCRHRGAQAGSPLRELRLQTWPTERNHISEGRTSILDPGQLKAQGGSEHKGTLSFLPRRTPRTCHADVDSEAREPDVCK